MILMIMVHVFISVLIHELGHALVAKKVGCMVDNITLYPIGGIATLQMGRITPRQVSWIAIGGPGANIILAAMCALSTSECLITLGIISFLLGVSNLLPINSFDGGLILKSCLEHRGYGIVADKILFGTSIFFALTVAVLAIYFKSITAGIAAIFILVYGTMMDDE